MMSDLESSYQKTRAQNETIAARIEVTTESLTALHTELKDTFNCDTLEEAEELRAQLLAARTKLEAKIESSLASVLN